MKATAPQVLVAPVSCQADIPKGRMSWAPPQMELAAGVQRPATIPGRPVMSNRLWPRQSQRRPSPAPSVDTYNSVSQRSSMASWLLSRSRSALTGLTAATVFTAPSNPARVSTRCSGGGVRRAAVFSWVRERSRYAGYGSRLRTAARTRHAVRGPRSSSSASPLCPRLSSPMRSPGPGQSTSSRR